MKLNPQRRQRIGNIARRLDMNGLEAERRAPSMFSARSSKNTMREAGTPIALRRDQSPPRPASGGRSSTSNRDRETRFSVSAWTFVK